MTESRRDFGKESEQPVDRDARPDKAETVAKQQSGRPPARPPYEQYLRVSKGVK
jgi:hypothetical protein